MKISKRYSIWNEFENTVNFTYNKQVYNKILLVTKSTESPGRRPITIHWVLYVCNKFVYNELLAITK